jgi:hypothetical protein
MAELRGGRDEPDDSDLPARRYPADAGDGIDEARPRAEPGPRADYAVAMRQIVNQRPAGEEQADQPKSSQAEAAPANTNQAEADHADGGQEDVDQEDTSPTGARQEDADPEEAAPGGADQDDADPADADQGAELSAEGALERFEPSRAGLPEVSYEDAAAYIEEHLADRPWLAAVRTCSRDVQRVFVALDQGHGHAHIRHDSWVTEEMNERRIQKLEDPAQLDQEKREDRVDAFKVDNQSHWCGSTATRITRPEIFAETFARGAEHPDVRAALESKDSIPPGPVAVPISDLLGPDGHRFCRGSQLEPVDGSMKKARNYRDAWATGNHSGPEPRIRPVETFEGGTVTFTFRPSPLGGYEVNTMYVNPPSEKP